MRQLLADNQDVFSNTPGATPTTVITIDTRDARPIYSPPYRLAHAQTPMVKKEIDQMLRAGIITASKSPWASPLLMVAKKDGTLRPVIDYHKLNKITKPDPFPMPRIKDLIDDLASATYITTRTSRKAIGRCLSRRHQETKPLSSPPSANLSSR